MLPTLLSERFVLLVFLQLQAWNCAARVLRARQGGGGRGGDSDSDSDSDTDSDSESCKDGVCTITHCVKKVCTTLTSTRGGPRPTAPAPTTGPNASTVPSLTQTPAPNQTASATRNNNNHHTTSRSSTLTGLSADPSLSSSRNNLSSSSGISKGGIAGLVIGLLIIIGLIAMCIAQRRRRIRKAKNMPQGFVPAAFLNAPSSSRGNNEMSEVNAAGSPVIAAAVRNRSGSGNERDSSISPLLPAAARGYGDRYNRNLAPPQDEYSSQRGLVRSGSRNRSDDTHSVLTSPYSENGEGINWASAPLPPLPPDAFTGAGAAATTVVGAGALSRTQNGNAHTGALHSDMRAFQKALEADEKQGLPGNSSHDISGDPPPSYSGL